MKKGLNTLIMIIVTLGITGCSYDKPLRKELTEIWHADQDIRSKHAEAWYESGGNSPKVDSLIRVMHNIDSINLIRVRAILDERGWIGRDKIGRLANNTLFLVIQHSDLQTQKKYLPMMREAVKDGKSEARWLALLEDRIALGEGRRQIYGSQIYWDKETGTSYVAPLEDPDNVDQRRKAVGLEPISKYLKQWNISWDAEEYKRQLPEYELFFNRLNNQ